VQDWSSGVAATPRRTGHVTHDPDEGLARGLAWAFLAADSWTRAALVSSAATALGRRPRWLGPMVDLVLQQHRSAPSDRPYELSRFVLGETPLLEHAARARRRRALRIVALPTVVGATGRRRWPVPDVVDLPALARLLEVPLDQLVWLADTQAHQRRTPAGPLHAYRHRWVERPGAVPRLLEAPTPLLRAVQRRVLERILVWVPTHPAAHGFVRGRSAISHARAHEGADEVVCLDLRAFFASVHVGRVAGLFRATGHPEAVAWTLACLCTHQTPVHVLHDMPPGGAEDDRAWLRAGLRGRHLAQGAPTSPALANLACFTLDRRLAGLAATTGRTYTRYADDLSFSGAAGRAGRLVSSVGSIVGDEGFRVHTTKTRVRSRGQRQVVTGLVVNDQVGVPREYHEQLRAVLHDAGRHGPAAANRLGHPDFRSYLEGRVGWVESVNPQRGRRLRAQLEAIVWPA